MKTKQKPNHYWNHRVMTTLIKYKELYPDNPVYADREDERIFFITEVHYENDIPVMYAPDMNVLHGADSVKDLLWAVNKIKLALKKPVIDKDNFPEVWKDGK